MSSGIKLKDQILKKFSDLIQVFGVKNVTTDMLAQKCGISKKTLYKHFSSKNDLVSRIIDDILNRLELRFDQIDKSTPDPFERLNHFFEVMYELLGSISTPVLEDVARDYPEINERIQSFREAHRELVRRSIAEGIEKGVFNPGINPEIAVALIMGAAERVMIPEYILKAHITLEKAIESFKILVMNGLVKK